MSTRRQKIERLCRKYGVKALYVFGSRAAEVTDLLQGRRASLAPKANDVDIAILTEAPLTVRQKVLLALSLEEILGAPRVDLIILNDADPFLAANAIRGNRLYARDEVEADEYDLYVLRRAGDLAPFERERIALILGEPTHDDR